MESSWHGDYESDSESLDNDMDDPLRSGNSPLCIGHYACSIHHCALVKIRSKRFTIYHFISQYIAAFFCQLLVFFLAYNHVNFLYHFHSVQYMHVYLALQLDLLEIWFEYINEGSQLFVGVLHLLYYFDI